MLPGSRSAGSRSRRLDSDFAMPGHIHPVLSRNASGHSSLAAGDALLELLPFTRRDVSLSFFDALLRGFE